MKDVTRNFVITILLFVFLLGAFSGILIPVVDAVNEMDTSVAVIENDTYKSYYDGGEFYDNFRSDIEAMGGYIYDSQSAGKSKNITTALDYEFKPVKQVITVMTTATGSKEHGNYVESKPLANAIVRLNGVPRYTDRNGQVRATLDREYVELFVEKNGYGPYIDIMEVTGEEKVVYLKKESDNIDIYGVMLTDIEKDPVNLINAEYTIFPEALGDYIANMQFLVNVKADRYMLLMGDEVIYSSNENIIYDIDFTDDMEDKKFYAQVEYQDILSEPVLLKLKISIPDFYKEEDEEEIVAYAARSMDFLNPFDGEDKSGIFDGFNLDFTKIPGLKKYLDNAKIKFAVDMRKSTITLDLGFDIKSYKSLENNEKDLEKINSVNKRVGGYKASQKNAKEQKKKCQDDVNEANEKKSQAEAKIKDDNIEIGRQEEIIKNLNSQMREVESNNQQEINRINREKEAAANRVNELKKDVDSNTDLIAKEMSTIAGYYNQIDEINAKQKEEIDKMSVDLQEANRIAENIRSDVEKTNKEVQEYNNRINNGNLDISNLDSLIKNIGSDIKDLRNLYAQNKKGINLGLEFFGTIKYNYRYNKISSFSVSMGVSFGFVFEGKFMAGYIPMFYVLHIDARLNAQIEAYNFNKGLIDYKKFYEYIFMTLGIGFEVELGVGVNDLLSISAFAGAKYSINGFVGVKEFWENINECAGSEFELKIGIRLKALYVFSYEYGVGKFFRKPNLSLDEIYDMFGNNELSALSATQSIDNILSQNIYDGSKPQIEKVGDDYVASWIDMELKGNEPRTVLKYSIFRDGSWSVPKAVYGSGSDFYHDMYFDGQNLHITWQNIKEGTDIANMEDMCKNSEIYYAKYDSAISQFVGVKQVTDNNSLDMGPKFVLQESDAQPLAIVWQRNSVDDIIGLTGRNSIVYSAFDGSNWGSVKTIYESGNYFSFVDSAYVDGELTIAFVEDMDNDLTTDDRKIIVCAETSQCKTVGGNFKTVNNPQFFKLDEKIQLTFYADGNVRYTEDYVTVNKFDIADGKINDTYKIIDAGNNLYVYYYKVGNDNTPQAYASIYDKLSDSWQIDVCLTSAENKVTYPSIAILPNGDILTVYNSLDRETEIVSLEFNIKQLRKDFEIEYAYNAFDVSRGDNFDLFVIIKNTGDYPIKSIEVSAFGKTDTLVLENAINVRESDTIKVRRVFDINAEGKEIITVRFGDIVRKYALTTKFTDISIDGLKRIDTEREYYDLILKNSSSESSKVYIDVFYNGEKTETVELFLDGNQELNYTYYNDEFVNGGYVFFEIRTEIEDKYSGDNSISFCVEYMSEKEIAKINPYFESMQIAKSL